MIESKFKKYDFLSKSGECMWIHMDLIKGMLEFSDTLYPSVNYAYTTIPTYPCGQIGFVMCSLDAVSIQIFSSVDVCFQMYFPMFNISFFYLLISTVMWFKGNNRYYIGLFMCIILPSFKKDEITQEIFLQIYC